MTCAIGRDADREVEARGGTGAVDQALLVGHAGNGRDLTGGQRDLADGVVVRVGHVEVAAVEGHTAGPLEASCGADPVGASWNAGCARDGRHGTIWSLGAADGVIEGVRDEQGRVPVAVHQRWRTESRSTEAVGATERGSAAGERADGAVQ